MKQNYTNIGDLNLTLAQSKKVTFIKKHLRHFYHSNQIDLFLVTIANDVSIIKLKQARSTLASCDA